MVMSMVRTAVAAGMIGSAGIFCAVSVWGAGSPPAAADITDLSAQRGGFGGGGRGGGGGGRGGGFGGGGRGGGGFGIGGGGGARFGTGGGGGARFGGPGGGARFGVRSGGPRYGVPGGGPRFGVRSGGPRYGVRSGGPRYGVRGGGPRYVVRGGRRIGLAPAHVRPGTRVVVRTGRGHRWRWRGRLWHSYGYITLARPYCTGFTPDGCYRRWIWTPVGYRCVKFCPW